MKQRHSDDLAIEGFTEAMSAKMAEKRAEGKGGWEDPKQCSVDQLAWLLITHIHKGDPIDVGNFAMMLFHRQGGREALANAAVYPLRPDKQYYAVREAAGQFASILPGEYLGIENAVLKMRELNELSMRGDCEGQTTPPYDIVRITMSVQPVSLGSLPPSAGDKHG